MVDVNRRQKRRAKNQLEKEEEKPKREKKITEKEKAPKKNEREKDLNIYINPYNFHLYRNLQINKNLITSKSCGDGAWQFHCDHVPPFTFKVFIYLTDVDENKAPFEIIYHPKKNIYPKLIPYGHRLWSWGLININYTDKLTEPYFQKKNFSNVYLINPNTRIPYKTLQKLKNDDLLKKK